MADGLQHDSIGVVPEGGVITRMILRNRLGRMYHRRTQLVHLGMNRVYGFARGDDDRQVLQAGVMTGEVARFEGGIEENIRSGFAAGTAIGELVWVVAIQLEAQ